MKKYLILAASSVALLAGTVAHADGPDGGEWYLRGNVGYGSHHDAEFDGGLFVGDIESEGGLAGSLGIGYDFGPDSDFANFRIELDADTLWTDMGSIGQTAKRRDGTTQHQPIATPVFPVSTLCAPPIKSLRAFS